MSTRPVLIMAGGTGGHVFPGLAVAELLRAREVPVAWLGTAAGLEAQAVPAAGIPLHLLNVHGLRGGGWRGWVLAPLVLTRAVFQALRTLRRLRPVVVLSMGGFAAGPGGLAAWLLRYPLVVHEQNAVPGLTNRILARLARRVLCAFPRTFAPRVRARVIGNPVRAGISALAAPEQRFAQRAGGKRVHLLVLGGSQGALGLNQIVPATLARLSAEVSLDVLHQTGRAHEQVARDGYQQCGFRVVVTPFVEDMVHAYGWADLVLARAGALTIAELTAAGLGALLVPFPHAVDDHQARNAQYMVDAGAALMLRQESLTPAKLAEVLEPLLTDHQTRLAMAVKARKLARPDAASALADVCCELGEVA